MRKSKVLTAAEAVECIRDGDVVASSGIGGIGVAENIMVALRDRFLKTASPRDLTLFPTSSQADAKYGGKYRGLDYLAEEGLVRRVIAGHWGLMLKLQAMVNAEKVEGYNLPQGVITHLFRDIAAGKPGTISQVGLGTFVDPAFGGGKVNKRAVEELVERITIHGEDYLFYKAFPIQVGLIRGTTADLDGNVTMEREALPLESLALAMAVHNSGGKVIVQVERIAERGTLNPQEVKVPGILVDHVVLAENPEYHMQTFGVHYNPAYSGEIRVPLATLEALALNERKVLARRAVMELRPGAVVNLGFGMPEGIANIAVEEGISDLMTLTTEPGAIGGVPAPFPHFGASTNATAFIDAPSQFDFYDGGGIDLAFLGLAQADRQGNLNVSKFGPALAGAGGFINITQNAKVVVFLGTFTTGGLQVAVEDGCLRILKEGSTRKFVKEVEHRTFSGEVASGRGKRVIYITERCVFRLIEGGLELIEIAPGVDLDRDILAHMDFVPAIAKDLRPMAAAIFHPGPMGILSSAARS
jgi:propionate CoA-transferase